MGADGRLGRLAELCRELRLPAIARDAARHAEEAERQAIGPLDYLLDLLETEVTERVDRRTARRLGEANFPVVKTLEGFDFRRTPALPEARIRQIFDGDWIAQAEPILFIGEPGTGKTHLASALGEAAARAGHRVRFVSAAALVTELVEARNSLELARVIARYARIEVLILDELAYIPLSRSDAELLFRVLGERHERRPTVVTTNLPFSEWTTMFPDPRLCRAIVDRLTHRAHIIETGTESQRLKDTLRVRGPRKEKEQ